MSKEATNEIELESLAGRLERDSERERGRDTIYEGEKERAHALARANAWTCRA